MPDNIAASTQPNAHLPAYTQAHIKQALLRNGASGTIYAYAYPESAQIVREVLEGGMFQNTVLEALKVAFGRSHGKPDPYALAAAVNNALSSGQYEYASMFNAAWTNRQDAVDKHFFAAWEKWSAPVVTLAPAHKNFQYPTAGASEGLREVINAYGQQARHEGFTPTIHVFHGEYEGFGAYANAAHINVVRHDRANWQEALDRIGPNDVFFTSQPSAIDGNVWDDFDNFATSLHAAQPNARLMLDLTYVGSVAKDYHINADHPNIPVVFFSLSKPFGVYYHRIGGVFSRDEYPGLSGNIWFKNLQALQTGTALLSRSDVFTLPRKYEDIRQQALRNVSARLGVEFNPSDVTLFATAAPTGQGGEVENAIKRGTPGQEFLRICITPELARLCSPTSKLVESQPINVPTAATGLHMRDLYGPK